MFLTPGQRARLGQTTRRQMPKGAVLQCLQNTYTANTDLTTTIPNDDTTPTSTEGTQVLSQAIRPTDNTNKVLCLVQVWGLGSGSGVHIAALFRGTTCINVVADESSTGDLVTDNALFSMSFAFLDSPASASAQTYTVRVGASAGTMRLNGTTIARLFGGTAACTLTVMEIAA